MLATFILAVVISGLIAKAGSFNFDSELTASESASEDLITVGFSQIGSESVWRSANTSSIQNALTRENGFFLKFQNARQKQDNQMKAIRSYISQRVDFLVFAPVTEYGYETVLLEAKEAGIPVILVDRMVNVNDDSLYTAFLGTDKHEEGKKAGLWLAEYYKQEKQTEEPINIVILRGTTGSSAEIGRTEGFMEIASAHKNWIVLDSVDADFTTAKGKEIMENFLKRFPDIDVVVSQNDDMTFGAIEAINEAGLTTGVDGDIVIISYDATKQALSMVQQGIINVDIECNPLQGDDLADILLRLKAGETVDKMNYIDEEVFTIDNVTDALDTRTY